MRVPSINLAKGYENFYRKDLTPSLVMLTLPVQSEKINRMTSESIEKYYEMVRKYKQGPEHNDYYVIAEALEVALNYIREEDARELILDTETKIKQ
jgi:hypothetical protein